MSAYLWIAIAKHAALEANKSKIQINSYIETTDSTIIANTFYFDPKMSLSRTFEITARFNQPFGLNGKAVDIDRIENYSTNNGKINYPAYVPTDERTGDDISIKGVHRRNKGMTRIISNRYKLGGLLEIGLAHAFDLTQRLSSVGYSCSVVSTRNTFDAHVQKLNLYGNASKTNSTHISLPSTSNQETKDIKTFYTEAEANQKQFKEGYRLLKAKNLVRLVNMPNILNGYNLSYIVYLIGRKNYEKYVLKALNPYNGKDVELFIEKKPELIAALLSEASNAKYLQNVNLYSFSEINIAYEKNPKLIGNLLNLGVLNSNFGKANKINLSNIFSLSIAEQNKLANPKIDTGNMSNLLDSMHPRTTHRSEKNFR